MGMSMGRGSTTRPEICNSTRRLDVATFYGLRSFRLERLFPVFLLVRLISCIEIGIGIGIAFLIRHTTLNALT